MNKSGDFLAMLFRMKNINRWGLMYNIRKESLSDHSLECALLAYSLAVIGNVYFKKDYNPERIASQAMLHDMSEILTGDLPTPVKYYNDEIKEAYKKVESISCEKMLSLLDSEVYGYYERLINASAEEHKIIKAADKLCAYIKCKKELMLNNSEFEAAEKYIKKAIDTMACEELKYFVDNYLDSFMKNLDDTAL